MASLCLLLTVLTIPIWVRAICRGGSDTEEANDRADCAVMEAPACSTSIVSRQTPAPLKGVFSTSSAWWMRAIVRVSPTHATSYSCKSCTHIRIDLGCTRS